MSRIVTIDIGNSRIKWACWHEGVIVSRGSALHAGEQLAEHFFQQLFSDPLCFQQFPSQVLAVCVAGEHVRQSLDAWVEQSWALSIDYLQTQNRYKAITHAYPDPSQHGADRWAALIAAQSAFPEEGLCVICAGTAITFDFIDQHGRHLGGYILPSFRSMHNALTTDTANVISAAEVFIDVGTSGEAKDIRLPASTNDAVNMGIHSLLQSGIRDICATAISDKGDVVQQVVITGGGAEDILNYPDMPAMKFEPDLVMLGLYQALRHENVADD